MRRLLPLAALDLQRFLDCTRNTRLDGQVYGAAPVGCRNSELLQPVKLPSARAPGAYSHRAQARIVT
jgi:hypothetical protein